MPEGLKNLIGRVQKGQDICDGQLRWRYMGKKLERPAGGKEENYRENSWMSQRWICRGFGVTEKEAREGEMEANE